MRGAEHAESSLRDARGLLGVAADADPAELARAYRRQARRLHPDISLESDATEQFRALQAAYRLALDAALIASRRSTADVETPMPVEHTNPVVVIGALESDGLSSPRRGGPRLGEWLVAGPVHVQPHGL
ncbi:DnaJ domain-containing protein [Nocardioides sp. AN3]